jgi:amino-acid N-acetyltransferase
LRWENFSVIEFQDQVIACGQLRQFTGCQELGSLVVDKSWRDHRGLGSSLVQHLIKEATAPVYVECMGWLVEFYEQLGFVKIGWKDLPKPLKIKFLLGQIGSKVLPLGVTLLQTKPLQFPNS